MFMKVIWIFFNAYHLKYLRISISKNKGQYLILSLTNWKYKSVLRLLGKRYHHAPTLEILIQNELKWSYGILVIWIYKNSSGGSNEYKLRKIISLYTLFK